MYCLPRVPPPASKWARIALVGALASAATGCADWVRTPYSRPSIEVPPHWTEANASSASPVIEPGIAWWEDFGDPLLNRLVETALRRNNDLAAATSRVRQANLRAALAASALRPAPSVTLNAAYSKSESYVSRSSGVSASVGYEADLWGRLASSRNAAQWEADATEQDRASTALALAATTASLYWQIAYLNERLASSAESLAYVEQIRTLVRAQYRAGAVSALELRQADAAVANQQALQSTLTQQRVEARSTLDLLFDVPPGEPSRFERLAKEPTALPNAVLNKPEAGLPASLLARRPDLRAVELRLRRTLAQGDAVRASYYPALTLTGTLGTASPELGRLLANPVATLGARLVLPFLRINDFRLDSKLAREQYTEAVIAFRQTLYRAFADVENALSARSTLREQGRSFEEQLIAARDVERLYAVRYRSGAATLQVWLDAQERRRAAELALTSNRLDRLNAQVTLYKALGGSGQS